MLQWKSTINHARRAMRQRREHGLVIALTVDCLISEIGDFTRNAFIRLPVSVLTPLEPSSMKTAARSPHNNKEMMMSTKGVNTATETPGNGPAAVDLKALAQQYVQTLRTMREEIPEFTMPHKAQPHLVGLATTVSEQAVESGLAASTTVSVLSEAVDADAVRFRQAYDKALSEVRDEMKITLAGLEYSIRLQRYKNGQATLRILHFAQRLAKSPEHAGLKAYVEEMRKGIRRRRRNVVTTPAPAPAPTPSTPA
jgi:hypothetical protein